jgi:hypothetical protein
MVRLCDGDFVHAAHDPMFQTMHENESICISIGSVLTDLGSRTSHRPVRTVSTGDPSFRRGRLTLALVEAAVEHLLGDAVF